MARAAVGGTVAAHGFQKLFGWFGGGGVDGTAEMFEKMGFTPAREAALASGMAEGIGGSMLALGIATPVAAAAVASNMAVAASVHRPNGFFAADGGFEFPNVLGTVAAGIALAGPGNLSVDRLFKHRYSKGWMGLACLAGGASAAATLISRREQAMSSLSDSTQTDEQVAEQAAGQQEEATETGGAEGSKQSGGAGDEAA